MLAIARGSSCEAPTLAPQGHRWALTAVAAAAQAGQTLYRGRGKGGHHNACWRTKECTSCPPGLHSADVWVNAPGMCLPLIQSAALSKESALALREKEIRLLSAGGNTAANRIHHLEAVKVIHLAGAFGDTTASSPAPAALSCAPVAWMFKCPAMCGDCAVSTSHASPTCYALVLLEWTPRQKTLRCGRRRRLCLGRLHS